MSNSQSKLSTKMSQMNKPTANVIMDEYRHQRMAGIVMTPENDLPFFRQFVWGQEPTEELLRKMPSSIFVELPEEGDLPDIFGASIGFWTMSIRAKKIIEEIEPGVHKFIPLRLKERAGVKVFDEHFIFCCGNVIDAVIISETDFTEGRGRQAFEKHRVLSPFGQTALEGEKIKGKHLWRGGVEFQGYAPPFMYVWFCSDALKIAIQRSGIEYWDFRSCVVR